ncbi:MAG: LPXTG cell wall anchor domain-containing protein [Phycisphaerales bacterium]|nr:LPXTG cell wall anchor domain-containing protein [Phycisphaerales bacterium]
MNTLAQFMGLPLWNWGLIIGLLVIVVVLWIVKKKQENY